MCVGARGGRSARAATDAPRPFVGRSWGCKRPRAQAADVTALRAALGADAPAGCDDIWLLRFCLSFSEPAKQESSVRACIAWRAANAPLLDSVREGKTLPKDALIKSLCLTDYHGATKYGEPVNIVRAGLCSPPALLAVVSAEEFFEWLMWQKEVSFLACDAAMRKNRLLVKVRRRGCLRIRISSLLPNLTHAPCLLCSASRWWTCWA